METFFIKALQLIVALVILVIIHEFGHYIFARMLGIKVEKFYLFFNPWFSLLKYYPDKGEIQILAWTQKVTTTIDGKKEEKEEPKAWLTFKCKPHNPVNKKGKPSWAATTYGIGWLPLGGYCAIAGMVDETKSAKDLASEPQPWEFRSKAAWKRFLVMVAGVLFNFLLAIAIYAGIAYHWGERTIAYQDAYEGLDYAQPMKDAGFRDGDILLTINGETANPKDYTQLWDMVQPGAVVTVMRDHKEKLDITIPKATLEEIASLKSPIVSLRIPVYAEQVQGGSRAQAGGLKDDDRILKVGNDTTPTLTEFFPALAKNAEKETPMLVERNGKELVLNVTPDENGKIGIMLRQPDKIFPFQDVKYSLLESLPRGWEIGTNQLVMYISSLKLIGTKAGIQQVGGFGAIGSLFPDKWDWYTFWQITAFLSIILAFMNIIPIPGLDGGYILFLIWEMLSGRKPSDKFLEVANTIGLSFLFIIMILANGNDIVRAFQ